MKKLKYVFVLLLIIFPFSFLLSACSFSDKEEVYITKIEAGETINTYIVTYSNGDTATLTFDQLANNDVYVTNIQKKEETETATTFTVLFSNNTTSVITCPKGKDGKDGLNGVDGDDFTLDKLEEYAISQGYDDFNTFLKEYFTLDYTCSSVETSINTALRSAVSIFTVAPYTLNNEVYYTISAGAGVIYKMDKSENGYSYIITNYHVVYAENSATKIALDIKLCQYGADDTITVTKPYSNANYYSSYTFTDSAVDCEYVGGSMNYDIAVLKVKTNDLLKNNERAQPVTVNENYNIGETAIAIGNPEGEGISATAGIVSVVSEELTMKAADETTYCTFRVMRIDTAVNGGNSGGGLFNGNGEIIGIVNAKVIDTSIENISYALPIDNVTKVANNIIYYYEKTKTASQVKKLNLLKTYNVVNSKAVYTYDENLKEYIIGIEDDLKVTELTAVGLLADLKVGDIVNSIKINNLTYTLQRAFQLNDLLLNVYAGDIISFNVTRGTETTNTKNFTVLEGQLSTIE